MKRVGVLHLSDLHCGSDNQNGGLGTVKDPTISESLKKDLIYPNKLKGFFDRVQDLLAKKQVNVVACTGDLGDKYKEDSIEKGLYYIKKLSEKLNVPMENVIVCICLFIILLQVHLQSMVINIIKYIVC